MLRGLARLAHGGAGECPDAALVLAWVMMPSATVLAHQLRTLRALHNPGCSWGLNPPVSSSDLAMVCRPRGYVDRLGECPGGAGVNG